MDCVVKNTFIGRCSGKLSSSRVRRLSREFIWIGIGQAAAILGAMVGVRILTGVLTPETYGHLALGMTVSTFANVVVFGPLCNGAIRFFAPASESGSLPRYFAAIKRLVLQASTAILLFALVICIGLVLAHQSKWISLVLPAFFFALFSGYSTTLSGMQNAARQRAVVALHKGILSWGRFLLAAGLVIWFGASSAVAMLGYCIAMLLVLLSQRFLFRRMLQIRDSSSCQYGQLQNHQWRNKILTYAWPFAAWGILAWARLVSDRWALRIFGTNEEVGFYAVLFQIGYYPCMTLAGLVMQLLNPICFQRAGDASDPQKVQHVYFLSWFLTLAVLVTTFIGTFLAIHLHREVFRLLVSPEYHFVSSLLPGIVLGAGLFVSAQFCSLGPLSRIDSKCLVIPKNVTAIVGILMNFLGAMWLGLTGVIVGNILFSLANLIWITFISIGTFRKCK